MEATNAEDASKDAEAASIDTDTETADSFADDAELEEPVVENGDSNSGENVDIETVAAGSIAVEADSEEPVVENGDSDNVGEVENTDSNELTSSDVTTDRVCFFWHCWTFHNGQDK